MCIFVNSNCVYVCIYVCVCTSVYVYVNLCDWWEGCVFVCVTFL